MDSGLEIVSEGERVSEVLDEGTLSLDEINPPQGQRIRVGKIRNEDGDWPEEEASVMVRLHDASDFKQVDEPEVVKKPQTTVFQTSQFRIFSEIGDEVIHQDQGYLLRPDVFIEKDTNVLVVYGRIFAIPTPCNLELTEECIRIRYEDFFAEILASPESVVLVFELIRMSVPRGQYVYLDKGGNLAFEHQGDMAVFVRHQNALKVSDFKLLFPDDRGQIMIKSDWVSWAGIASFKAREGILKFRSNAVKMPQHSTLRFSDDGVDIAGPQMKTGESRRLTRFNFRSAGLELIHPRFRVGFHQRMRLFLDHKGKLAFQQAGELAVLIPDDSLLQVGALKVAFHPGQHIRIQPKWLILSDRLKIHPENRSIHYDRSRMAYAGAMQLHCSPDSCDLRVRNRSIKMIPQTRQMYLLIGGRLVIVTVTIGIALDKNGNLAFDYRGMLTTLDTDAFVLNVGGYSLDLGALQDINVELIGQQIIVSQQDESQSIMDRLQKILAEQGVLELLQQTEALDIPFAELIELLLNFMDLETLIQELQKQGAAVSDDVLTQLMALFGPQLIQELMDNPVAGGPGTPMMALLMQGGQPQLLTGSQVFPIDPQGLNVFPLSQGADQEDLFVKQRKRHLEAMATKADVVKPSVSEADGADAADEDISEAAAIEVVALKEDDTEVEANEVRAALSNAEGFTRQSIDMC